MKKVYTIEGKFKGVDGMVQCYSSAEISGYLKNNEQLANIIMSSNGVTQPSKDLVWNFFYHFVGKSLNQFACPKEEKFQLFDISPRLYNLLDFNYLRGWIKGYKVESNFLFFILEIICEKFKNINRCRIPLKFDPTPIHGVRNTPNLLRKSYLLSQVEIGDVYNYNMYFCASYSKIDKTKRNYEYLLERRYIPDKLPIRYVRYLHLLGKNTDVALDFLICESEDDKKSEECFFNNGEWNEFKSACICSIGEFKRKYQKHIISFMQTSENSLFKFVGSLIHGFHKYPSVFPDQIRTETYNIIKLVPFKGQNFPFECTISEKIELLYYIGVPQKNGNLFDYFLFLNRAYHEIYQFFSDFERAEYDIHLIGSSFPASDFGKFLKTNANEYLSAILAEKCDSKEYEQYVLSAASLIGTINALF